MGSPVAPLKRGARGRLASPGRERAELAGRLSARRDEIEAAAATRIYAISDPGEINDPQYFEGLRAALVAAVDYGLAAIELGEERCPPPPPALLVQARMAARAGVGLDTVLRRYFAGYSLLADFLIEETEASDIRGSDLQRLLRTQATLFERLLAAVGEEHARESEERLSTVEERKAEQVERLLAGELVDVSGLAYDFEGHHLGLVAQGPGALEAIGGLAAALDRTPLAIRREEEVLWAWLGSRRPAQPGEMHRLIAASWPAQMPLAIGEPGEGLEGWRLTHRQAKAALPIALRGEEKVARYGNVALLASMLRDELLLTSLRDLYIAPLEGERDGGAALRETLRAYFAAGRNGASAAAALGVSRQTINNRIRAVEERIGRSAAAWPAELEAVVQLEELGHPSSRPWSGP